MGKVFKDIVPSQEDFLHRPFKYLDPSVFPEEIRKKIYRPDHPKVGFHDPDDHPGCDLSIKYLDYKNHF